jgi:hypothetical protein
MPDTAARRAIIVTVLIAVVVAAAIWLLVFDMWLGQVERQYLWENARHELKLGPAVSLKAMTDEGRTTGALVATAWSALVAAAVLVAGFYGYTKGRISGASWTR